MGIRDWRFGQAKTTCPDRPGREPREGIRFFTNPESPFPNPGPQTKSPARGGAFRYVYAVPQASATTLTVRRFFGPLIENSTLPSTSANRV